MTALNPLEYLCYYDPRNPDGFMRDDDDPPYNPARHCACDNCFYGRKRLAERIIELENKA